MYDKYIQILVVELKRPSVFISKDSFLVRSTPTFTLHKELNGVLPPQFSGMLDDTRNRSYTVTSVSRQDSCSVITQDGTGRPLEYLMIQAHIVNPSENTEP